MTQEHRIVVLEKSVLLPLPWQFNFPHQLTEYDHTDVGQIASRIADATIIVTDHAVPDRLMMQSHPHLQLIALSSTGYNHVDVVAAKEQGITVCNVRNYGEQGIAEHAFMLMLTLSRKLLHYRQDIQLGKWQTSSAFCHFGEPIHDVFGKTLVIFGKGAIGSAVADRARAFGMKVVFGEQKQAIQCRDGYLAFDEAIAQADFISLHCPLTEQTYHMLDQSAFAMMKPGCILINVGRGQLVDERALLSAIETHHLGGAGIDVLSEEPPSQDHLLLQQTHPNLIITPHVAWASEDGRTRLFNMINDNVNQFAAGTPKNVVV